MTHPEIEQLELHCGDVSAMEARVFARLPVDKAGEWQLTGHILGPYCLYARTLPATIPFRRATSSMGLSSVAILPDPCLWTPQVPMLYEVQLELRRGESIVATVQRSLAIRSFGPRGRSMQLSGKRWVMRGVQATLVGAAPLAEWHDVSATMVLPEPDHACSIDAARHGVPLLALIRATAVDHVSAALRRLARSPAALVAAIDSMADLPADIGLAASDIRLAAHCDAKQAPTRLPSWASMLLCESADSAELVRAVSGRPFPVIALRPTASFTDLATARLACDQLQRDLAPHVDLAGYCV